MRLALMWLAMAVLLAACGETSNQGQASPTPTLFGTATLSDSGCDFAMPQQVPVGVLKFKIVNHSSFTGRFMLVQIHDGHKVAELVNPDNAMPAQKPDWVTDIGIIDVSTGQSDVLTTSVHERGTYAFHCGYADASGKVTAFWNELHAG